MNVSEAARDGSDLDLMVAMRDRIAEAISEPDCPKRDLASLTLRLSNIVKEINALKSAEGEDALGEAANLPDDDFDPNSL